VCDLFRPRTGSLPRFPLRTVITGFAPEVVLNPVAALPSTGAPERQPPPPRDSPRRSPVRHRPRRGLRFDPAQVAPGSVRTVRQRLPVVRGKSGTDGKSRTGYDFPTSAGRRKSFSVSRSFRAQLAAEHPLDPRLAHRALPKLVAFPQFLPALKKNRMGTACRWLVRLAFSSAVNATEDSNPESRCKT
jgi:hypothetical protein